MERTKKVIWCIRWVCLALLLMLCWRIDVTTMQAQTPPITAELNQDIVSVGETVILTIVINGDSNSGPELPSLDNLQIVGSSSSSQLSVFNGQVTSKATYRYTLQAIEAGRLTIDPIIVTLDGQRYQTEPLNLTILRGTTPAQPTRAPSESSSTLDEQLSGQDFFVEAEVDNPTPYLGEQVFYRFRFYQARSVLGQPNYNAPNFAGFWHDQETTQDTYTVQADGRTYRVSELQTLLFPTVGGEREIEPATLSLPLDLFQNDEKLPTNSVPLNVKPLPSNAPDDFAGAVGKYTLSAQVDSNQVSVDEPITLKVTLQGEGNIATLPEPALPELPDWRAFERTSNTNSGVNNGILMGERVDEQLLVPTQAGEYTIPSISYSYFDPKAERYETLTTEPIPITVLPAGGTTSPPVEENNPEPNNEVPESPPVLLNEMRHIKAVPPTLEANSPPLPFRPTYWLIWLLPLLLLGVDLGWQWRQRWLGADPFRLRQSQAARNARRLLADARKSPSEAHAKMNQALTGYLADKLNHSVAGLSQRDVHTLLTAQALPAELIQQVNQLLIQNEMQRFAPVGHQPADISKSIKEAENLIKALERALP